MVPWPCQKRFIYALYAKTYHSDKTLTKSACTACEFIGGS